MPQTILIAAIAAAAALLIGLAIARYFQRAPVSQIETSIEHETFKVLADCLAYFADTSGEMKAIAAANQRIALKQMLLAQALAARPAP